MHSGHNLSLHEGIRDFAPRSGGAGVVVLITDLMDKQGFESALRMLIGRRMDVVVIHLLAAEELEPPLRGDLRLVDAEDNDSTEVTLNEATLRKYRETVTAFINSARQFCSRRAIGYILVRNDTPIDELITRYLRQRGVLR